MRETIESGANEIVCQKWEESERGWGVRADGFSLHISLESLARFVHAFNNTLPDAVPDEYSRPAGIPYPVRVADDVFQEVEASGDGLRFYHRNYPGTGGIDTWRDR